MLLLVKSAFLGVFVNTLTTDDKYSCQNIAVLEHCSEVNILTGAKDW